VRDLAGNKAPVRDGPSADLYFLGLAAADALISVFDAKYTYNFWRPITAIRNGGAAGSSPTIGAADWEPLVDTPMHPEYPCAHCITSAAVGIVLQSEFGTGTLAKPLSMTSSTAPGVTRQWSRIQDYYDEVAVARIYGGMHYRNSAVVGQDMGRKIGQIVVQGCMKPLRTATTSN
jgi:hypothetical protein